MRLRGSFPTTVPAILALAAATVAAADPLPVTRVERAEPFLFETDVLPILRRDCLACHGAAERHGDLVLETVEGLLRGGDSGPAIVPGSAEKSLLFTLAAHRDEPVMPPAGNAANAADLGPEALGVVAAWIDQGAKSAGPTGSPSPRSLRPIAPAFVPASAVAVAPDAQYVAVARSNRLLLHHAQTGRLVTPLVDPAVGDAAHGDLVGALAFNRDGDMLASGGFREVKIWRRPRDVRAYELPGAGPVTALATSPDGRFVATAAPGAVRIWDAADGRPGATFAGPPAGATALVFSADGELLFAGGGEGGLRCMETATGTLVGTIETAQPVAALAHVPARGTLASAPGADHVLAVGGTDATLRTFRPPDAVPVRIGADPEPGRRFAAAPDGRLLVTTGQGGRVRVVAVEKDGASRPLGDWPLDGGPATSLCLVAGREPGMAAVATGGADGAVSLWSIPEGRLLRRSRVAASPVVSLAATPDGARIVSGDDQGRVGVWHGLDRAAPPAVVGELPLGQVTATAFHPGRRLLAVAGSAGGRPAIAVRPLDGAAPAVLLTGPSGPVRALAFAADGSRLCCGGDDRMLCVWDWAASTAPLATIADAGTPTAALAPAPDPARLLVAGTDHVLRVWSLAEAKPVREYRGHTAAVLALGWDGGGQPWSASADGTVRAWSADADTQASAWNLPAPPLAVAPSIDGQRLLAVGGDGVVRSHERAGGQLVKAFQGAAGKSATVAFSGDGTRATTLETAGDHVVVRLWRVDEGRLHEAIDLPASAAVLPETTDTLLRVGPDGGVARLATTLERHLDGPPQPVTGLVATAGGVVVATADGAIRGYQAATGQPTFTASHGAPLTVLSAAADGSVIATGGKGGIVRFWKPDGNAIGPGVTALPGDVTAVALAADGRRAVVGLAAVPPGGAALTLHDPATGLLLERFSAHTSGIAGIGVDASGNVLSAGDDAIWRWRPGALDVIAGHGGAVTAIAPVPGATLEVVTGSADGVVRRIRLDEGRVTGQFQHGGRVTGVAVRPDGQRIASVGESGSLRLWRADGQPVAEVRGDLRRAAAVSLLTRQQTAATERIAIFKQRVESAEKDLPAKTDAATKAKAALDEADADVKRKQDAFAAADAARIEAEKIALAASAEARSANVARQRADREVRDAQVALQSARQKAALLATAAAADAADTARKQASDAAVQAVTATEQRVGQMQSAAQAAATAATAAATAANGTTQKVTETQKPAADASAALRTARSAQRLAVQQHEIAAREAAVAAEALPVARDGLARAEAGLAAAKQALEAATAAAAAAVAPVRHVAFAPDGGTVATAGDFPAAHLWDGETGSALAAFAGHGAGLVGVAFLPGGRLVTAGGDAAAIAWEQNPPWRLERTIGGAGSPDPIVDRVTALDWNADSSLLLVGSGVPSRSGELGVFQVASGSRTLHLPDAHDDAVLSARFSPDGRRLASAGADKYVRTFDSADGSRLRRLEGHTGYVLGVAWKGDGQTLASAAADNTVKVWDAETGDQRLTTAPFGRHVTALRFVGDGDTLATAGGDGVVRILNAANGGTVRTFPSLGSWIHSLDVTPGGEVLVVGPADGILRGWNAATGQPLPPFEVVDR